ncbi:MAG: beta-ketoacyl-ACP synthase II [Candidatus Omnitrophica bacterium]|nr:beta-ketoacyl-ACP synthase II [Candidatus Omnitrophota bacterium]
MQKRRVVVTGIGVISPFGVGTEIFWKSLIEGKSGIRPITHFDAAKFDCRIAGVVTQYNPLDHFSTKEARHLAPFVQYSVVSSREAIAMAKLDLKNINPERMGVLIGSGIGCLHTLEDEHSKLLEKGPSRMSPFFIPKMIINEAAGQVSIETGAKGPATCVVTACATATNAIGDAFRFIQFGDADIMLAGGSESAATPLGIGGFCALKALSQRNDDPEKASRPFDLNRDGFVMADGAGVTLLETLDHAKARGANILAEVVGYGRTSDAFHITAPESSGLGASRSMKLALDEAGILPKDLSYINAHGTSTYLNDKVETLAVKNVFKEHAKLIPMSSTKSMTGHLLGAAGGVEFAASVMTIRDNIIAPTINLDTPDPECDLDYVPNHARKANINSVMSNSLGFGGHNASILIKRFKE